MVCYLPSLKHNCHTIAAALKVKADFIIIGKKPKSTLTLMKENTSFYNCALSIIFQVMTTIIQRKAKLGLGPISQVEY